MFWGVEKSRNRQAARASGLCASSNGVIHMSLGVCVCLHVYDICVYDLFVFGFVLPVCVWSLEGCSCRGLDELSMCFVQGFCMKAFIVFRIRAVGVLFRV